tara:strand:- start:564 stop:935 length:372 start_codon:yes stop_codon:yes gene_type:complete
MSTLAVGTIKSASSAAPVFQNSSGTEKGQLAKVWIMFTGSGTIAINDSFNVSSIADRGTGNYTVNFTNAMSNANYSAVFGANGATAGYAGSETQNTSSIDTFGSFAGSFNDMAYTNMAIFGDN